MKIIAILTFVLWSFSFAGVWTENSISAPLEIAEKSPEKNTGTNAGPDQKKSKSSKKEKKEKSSGSAGTNKAAPAAESR